jgi:cell division protease FtsH
MDIQQATQFARHMILEWGMSKRLGFVGYAGADTRDVFIPEREYSDETARIIDEEVKGLIDKAYASAEKIIDQHWEQVEAIAEALLKYETLQGEEIERIVRGERLDKPTVAELLEKEASKTARPAKTQPAPDEGGPEPAGGDVLPSPA